MKSVPLCLVVRLIYSGVAFGLAAHAAQPISTTPLEGLRDASPRVHALVGARIVAAPDQVIDNGTIVVRDGVIEAVGAGLAAPADARVWDAKGRTIYAGLTVGIGR